jgi:hypothetical protein
MSTTSLQHKTVRPGSLVGYSYYHSNRRAAAASPRPQLFTAGAHRHLLRWAVLAVLLVGVVFVAPLLRSNAPASSHVTAPKPTKSTPAAAPAAAPAKAAVMNHCAGNAAAAQLVVVSISQRHLWACEKTKTAYDSPVITGMVSYDATLTPPGTYHVYAKQTNVTLTGSDVTGSWNDPVQYWMPFLNNQYGTYGFHDATWRANSAFGNISPNSSDASHGCVELPLATSQWLYNWVRVGTAVTIES